MDSMSKINQELAKYAEKIPDKGAHLSYLSTAAELVELYSEASSIMEEEKSLVNEEKVKKIETQIENIVG